MCLGLPGRVVEIGADGFPCATVDVAGTRRVVHTGALADGPPVAVGDWLLIHVGFALGRLEEDEAARAVEFLTELAAVDGG